MSELRWEKGAMDQSVMLGRFRLVPYGERSKDGRLIVINGWRAWCPEDYEVCTVSHPWPCDGETLLTMIEQYHSQRHPASMTALKERNRG